MSELHRSIALLRHPEQLEELWLAHWDARGQCYDFVTAQRLEKDSFRECLDREIAWQLELRRGKDYLISSMARLHLDLELELPDDQSEDGSDLRPAVEFYIVDLYGRAGRATIEANSNLRWLSGREVLAGTTADGKNVAPGLVTLLKMADVIAGHTR